MQKFWQMLPRVPMAVAFVAAEPFDTPGLRWAPRTLLMSPANKSDFGDIGSSISDVVSHATAATPTPRGLLLNSSGLLFATHFTPIGQTAFVRDEGNTWYHIFSNIRKGPDTQPYVCEVDGAETKLSINPGVAYGYQEVAFVAHLTQHNKSTSLTKSVNPFNSLSRLPEIPGILVGICEEKDGIIYTRRLCNAHCSKMEPAIHSANLSYLDCIHQRGAATYGSMPNADPKNGTLVSVVGMAKPHHQRWCIG